MNKKIILIIGVAIILVGGYLFFSGEDVSAPEGSGDDTTSLGVPAPGFEDIVDETIVFPLDDIEYTVSYTGSGFTPASITVAVGDTVTFINDSGSNMWVASILHPSHKVYGGTTLSQHCADGSDNSAFDQCETGNSYSFTFDKIGNWKYHNHIRAGIIGTVVVVEEL